MTPEKGYCNYGPNVDDSLHIYSIRYEECHIQAGLVLWQSYVSKKYHTQQTQNSHLKECMTIPLVNMQTCRVYVLYIQYIYFSTQYTHISIQYIYF